MDLIENAVQIDLPNGESRVIALARFPAMDGWDIQHRFMEFVSTSDKAIRRAYTLEVLEFAKVVIGDNQIPIRTDALIESHLQSWQNVEKVFNTVLLFNGINPDTHADRPNYWSNAGGELAVAFMAVATKLIGPALEGAAEGAEQNQG